MIKTVEFMTESECRNVRDRICDLRKYWVQRHVFLPYYTLGATSYLDTTDGALDDGYYAGAQKFNPVLQENFGWLYNRLSGVLSAALEAPAFHHEGFALPGFHLFLSDKLFEDGGLAAIHFDQQYHRLVWQNPGEIDFEHPVSFTLAIAMPRFGGGMYVWDMWLEETKGLSDDEIVALRSSRTREYHQYRVGSLFIHSGHFMHQIAPFFDVQPEDERFTLQGHAVRLPDGWHYYW